MPHEARPVVRTFSVAVMALVFTVVAAVTLHVAIPEVLRFSESPPPAPGSVLTAEQMQEKELLAQRQLQQAMASSPRPSVGSLVSSALSRFGWAALLAQACILLVLRRTVVSQRVVAQLPLVVLVSWAGSFPLLVVVLALSASFELTLKAVYARSET